VRLGRVVPVGVLVVELGLLEVLGAQTDVGAVAGERGNRTGLRAVRAAVRERPARLPERACASALSGGRSMTTSPVGEVSGATASAWSCGSIRACAAAIGWMPTVPTAGR
jgi:hypothetical protein